MTNLRIAIIGCGNPNRSDDGAGLRVIQRLRLQADAWSGADVSLLDAGTDGMAVMFAARGCSSLILVDACCSGAQAGAVFEVPGSELAEEPTAALNLHDFRWDHAIAAGRKLFGEAFPSDVVVFLIEACTLDFGLELSAEVDAATALVAARIDTLVRERCALETPASSAHSS
jgi:hydrogenase maturation protease